ncbi:competence/damage-inducible protein A [Occallatibacter riparius]|uniref:CinA-like protein n=1 Tax=Occallatibacter riparius TaxID=1002689 RepID=A0A9J7BNZ9_9BACT|nr:competence/damage-inducible protein A [Occallatibacter riparius]UWZ82646.1 competence/damage-inducible protein A [Occallatibacter riparius]
MKSEIVAIGSEMLTPFRQDTNSLFLTEKLNEIGVTVAFKTIVGDRRKDLVNAIRTALGRADILILMGGLGPTEDDLTREATAEALNLELRREAPLVAALHARAATWRIAMPENNLKQADVIDGATVLQNANGSAPGQWLDVTFEGFRKLIMLIPGPPSECKPLFEAECLPRLREIVPPRFIAKRTLKAAMIPESQCDKLLAPIYTTYTDIETTILAHNGDIQLSLLCAKRDMDTAEQRVEELATKMEEALDDWLYSTEGETLEQIVLYYLGLRQATLATAESCTGGLVAQRITAIPGSSRSFLGGALVYSNELKTAFAGVPPELIEQHGAVSEEVASALASGIRQRTGATIGLGITGIAGPTGGTDTKPVGLVYIAVSDPQRTDVLERNFRGPRQRVREWTAQQALDLIRRKLM